MDFNAYRWVKAEDATIWRRSRVQCFHYRPGPEDRAGDLAGLHVVRDLTLDPGHQIIWQKEADHDEYEAVHREMMEADRRYCIELIWQEYCAPVAVEDAAGAME